MAYSTAQSLIDRFGAMEIAQVSGPRDLVAVTAENLRIIVADPDNSEGGITDADEAAAAIEALARIDEAIETAESLIDGALAKGGYVAPITSTVPAAIVSACEDLARYDLHKERPTETIKQRFDAAMQILKKIESGSLSVGLTVKSDGPLVIGVSAPDQVFDEDLLSQYAG